MSNNIKNVTKSIGNTMNVATSAVDVSTELLSDVSSVAVSTLRGALPVTKSLGRAVSIFTVRAFNEGMTEEEVKVTLDNVNVNSMLQGLEHLAFTAAEAITAPDEDNADKK